MAEPQKVAPLQIASGGKNGHHFVNKKVKRMLLQWAWRKTVLPCSPKEMMTHLQKPLKKDDG